VSHFELLILIIILRHTVINPDRYYVALMVLKVLSILYIVCINTFKCASYSLGSAYTFLLNEDNHVDTC
jgi:hypothetical protein